MDDAVSSAAAAVCMCVLLFGQCELGPLDSMQWCIVWCKHVCTVHHFCKTLSLNPDCRRRLSPQPWHPYDPPPRGCVWQLHAPVGSARVNASATPPKSTLFRWFSSCNCDAPGILQLVNEAFGPALMMPSWRFCSVHCSQRTPPTSNMTLLKPR